MSKVWFLVDFYNSTSFGVHKLSKYPENFVIRFSLKQIELNKIFPSVSQILCNFWGWEGGGGGG